MAGRFVILPRMRARARARARSLPVHNAADVAVRTRTRLCPAAEADRRQMPVVVVPERLSAVNAAVAHSHLGVRSPFSFLPLGLQQVFCLSHLPARALCLSLLLSPCASLLALHAAVGSFCIQWTFRYLVHTPESAVREPGE